MDGATHGRHCAGHSSRTGKPCKKAPILGGTVCATHGGSAPQVQQKARERLAALAPQAVQTLAALLIRDEFPTVQLGAARYVFDQAEGTATENMNVRVSGQMDIVTVLHQRHTRSVKSLAEMPNPHGIETDAGTR